MEDQLRRGIWRRINSLNPNPCCAQPPFKLEAVRNRFDTRALVICFRPCAVDFNWLIANCALQQVLVADLLFTGDMIIGDSPGARAVHVDAIRPRIIKGT
jgi:hypothetical protein